MDKKQRNKIAKSNGEEQQGEKVGGNKINKQNRTDIKNATNVANLRNKKKWEKVETSTFKGQGQKE